MDILNEYMDNILSRKLGYNPLRQGKAPGLSIFVKGLQFIHTRSRQGQTHQTELPLQSTSEWGLNQPTQFRGQRQATFRLQHLFNSSVRLGRKRTVKSGSPMPQRHRTEESLALTVRLPPSVCRKEEGRMQKTRPRRHMKLPSLGEAERDLVRPPLDQREVPKSQRHNLIARLPQKDRSYCDLTHTQLIERPMRTHTSSYRHVPHRLPHQLENPYTSKHTPLQTKAQRKRGLTANDNILTRVLGPIELPLTASRRTRSILNSTPSERTCCKLGSKVERESLGTMLEETPDEPQEETYASTREHKRGNEHKSVSPSAQEGEGQYQQANSKGREHVVMALRALCQGYKESSKHNINFSIIKPILKHEGRTNGGALRFPASNAHAPTTDRKLKSVTFALD